MKLWLYNLLCRLFGLQRFADEDKKLRETALKEVALESKRDRLVCMLQAPLEKPLVIGPSPLDEVAAIASTYPESVRSNVPRSKTPARAIDTVFDAPEDVWQSYYANGVSNRKPDRSARDQLGKDRSRSDSCPEETA